MGQYHDTICTPQMFGCIRQVKPFKTNRLPFNTTLLTPGGMLTLSWNSMILFLSLACGQACHNTCYIMVSTLIYRLSILALLYSILFSKLELYLV